LLIKKAALYFIIILVLLVVSTWMCAHMGLADGIDGREIDRVIISEITGTTELETPIHTIVWELRLPRIILAALIGAALSMSGAAFQGLLRNPLADPYIVGTSAGAAVGGVIAIVTRVRTEILGVSLVTFFAFIGAMVAMYIIYKMSLVDGRIPVETFLLAGVVVGSFLWAFVSFMLTIAGKNLHEVVFWLMGSTQQATWQSVLILLIYVSIGFVGLMFLSHPLNLLTLGDESAEHLGVNVERTKLLVIIFASLITAAAVSVSGLIGFVGLMIPHVVRMLLGADHRVLIPISAFAGALFLMWVDTFARSILPNREIPVGILTAIMGAPFFLHLLRKRKMNL
jgi:iron complex transport system permease protein